MESEKKKALVRFQQSLEDLTFNSKPLIDDLTRVADTYKMFAAQIIETLESRIMQVRVDWKLPALYLLDSILKNLTASYKEEISRIIVGVFCHCFEKLVEPDVRKALYKLRLTWAQYLSTRKLAAIDRHVRALDPNWPVMASEGPPSPTIFVNPKFLGAPDNAKSQKSRKSASPTKNLEEKKDQSAAKRGKSPKPPATGAKDKSPVKVTKGEPSAVTEKHEEPSGPLSLQEMRKKLLEQKKKQKLEQQKVLGLGPASNNKSGITKEGSGPSAPVSKVRKGAKTKARTPPMGGRSLSPAKAVRRDRPRSVSPLPSSEAVSRGKKTESKKLTAVNHVGQRQGSGSGMKHRLPAESDSAPPTEKRPKLEQDNEDVDSEMVEIEESKRKSDQSTIPIKKTQLELDDLPPQLLSKHQELILKQVKVKKGGLSEEQHKVIENQIKELYKLQKMKENRRTPPLPPQTEGRCEEPSKTSDSTSSQTLSTSQDNRDNSSDLSSGQKLPPKSNSFGKPSETVGIRGRFPRYPSGGPPPPHVDHFPPEDRYAPPHQEYNPRGRGGFRPWRGPPPSRRGPPRRDWYPEGPLPDMYQPPPRRVLPGPPPPRLPRPREWHEPMEIDQGPMLRGPPPPPSGPPTVPVANVSELFSKLVETGMIEGSQAQTQDPQKQQSGISVEPPREQVEPVPLNIPNLSFHPATLKQRYSALVSLLNAGEPCTSCGLRFTDRSGEVYRKHLDWHFKMNRKESEGQSKTSRNWFMHPEDWLTYEELAEDDKEKDTSLKPLVTEAESREQSLGPSEEEPVSCQVLPGEGNEVCYICQEPFEQFWEEEEEEWHFKDAMRNEGKLYHTSCFKDAKESGNLDTSGSQLPSPVVAKEDPLTSSL